MTQYSQLDEALILLAPYGAERIDRLTNHAPMVAEALSNLSCDAAAVEWVKRERPYLAQRPPQQKRISEKDWPSAAGDPDRFSDWALFFSSEIDSLGWRAALEKWTAMLAPGFVSVAMHGVIRTAHAAREMRQTETAARRRELADALASWAAYFHTIGNAPKATLKPSLTPIEAIHRTPLIPEDDRENEGSIVDALGALEKLPQFAEVIGWIDVEGDLESRLIDIGRAFAGVFINHARDRLTAIVFTHAVTGAAAALNLAPSLQPNTSRKLARFAWEAGAGLYSAYGAFAAPEINTHEITNETSTHALVEAAIANGDEHVIKLTEACLNFYARSRNRLFLTPPMHFIKLITSRDEAQKTSFN